MRKKFFKSILNNDKLAASELFNTKYNEINRVLRNSRLKNLFLELVNFNGADTKKFITIKKTNLIKNQIIISEIVKIFQKCLKTMILDMSSLKGLHH